MTLASSERRKTSFSVSSLSFCDKLAGLPAFDFPNDLL